MCLSEDDKYLAFANSKQHIYIYAFGKASYEYKHTIKKAHDFAIQSLQIKNKMLITASLDGKSQIYDLNTF